MTTNGPTNFHDRLRVGLAISFAVLNLAVIGFVVYYEFVMKKRRLNVFNILYLSCHTCITLVFVTHSVTFWFEGQSTGNSWLNCFINFFFETFMGTYIAIMYIKTKGLLTLKKNYHYVAKGLSVTCYLLTFFATFTYFISSILVTINGGTDTFLSAWLINTITLYCNYGSGGIVATLDIFYLVIFRQFLISKARKSLTKDKATKSEDNLNFRIISWFGGVSSILSFLSLLLYVFSPFINGFGYFPVFVPANMCIISILGMKLSLDRFWGYAVNLARGEEEKRTRTKGSESEDNGNVISSLKFSTNGEPIQH